ncbi:MAG: biotin synthase BioB [Candidatus Omnitrophica bacterium]|nr:biotin synthase BioB [Candidatus Omnitrophota bacterium]
MNKQDAERIIKMPLEELLLLANRTRSEEVGREIEICGVVNAKSGKCSEDCKFCAQSGHYSTELNEFSLRSKDDIVSEAIEAKRNGSDRFGIVTSGNRLTRDEIRRIAEAISEIRKRVDIIPCASLGALDADSFAILKEAGLSRYHHNLETSERFYPQIVSTHDYSERVNTIRNAAEAGLEVCSGGIFGLGETWEDRIDMAFLLKAMKVDSVPMNFLVPIKGTPLENAPPISPLEAIRTIALFRLILKGVTIKVVAGRETVLKDFQGMMYSAGANGMMVGGYLTIAGRSPEEDQALIGEIKKLWNEE